MRIAYFKSPRATGGALSSKNSFGKPFPLSGEDESEDLLPIGDTEFYATLAMLIAGVAVLALTIGPFAIL